MNKQIHKEFLSYSKTVLGVDFDKINAILKFLEGVAQQELITAKFSFECTTGGLHLDDIAEYIYCFAEHNLVRGMDYDFGIESDLYHYMFTYKFNNETKDALKLLTRLQQSKLIQLEAFAISHNFLSPEKALQVATILVKTEKELIDTILCPVCLKMQLSHTLKREYNQKRNCYILTRTNMSCGHKIQKIVRV